jgi:glycosyltransferase involved in cell wall biosynthesis
MKLAIDVSPAAHRRAGIGRYAQELVAALMALDPGRELVAFFNDPATAHLDPPLDRLPAVTCPWANKPWRLRVMLAYALHRPQDLLLPGIGLFHATDNLLPRLGGLRRVFTAHDLAFRHCPETHTPLNRWFLRLMLPRFLRHAEAVIAVSASTKRDVVRLYGLPESKVTVVHEAVTERFRPASIEAQVTVRRRYGLPERFVLFVGTLEPRKNLVTLLQAYHALRDRGLAQRLVAVGARGWRDSAFHAQLRSLGLEDDVVLPGYVPDEDLPAIYSAADLFAFPSLREGFGLPVLEAMACGVPVVTSNVSALPEVVGDAGLLVSPRDVPALAAAIERVLADPHLQQALRAKGMARAAFFSWDRAARETLAVYESVLRRDTG